MAYIGTSPSNGVRRVHTYTATASQTTFSGASSEGVTLSYADTNYLDVYQNGILLGSADYTATSGTSVVLTQAASASDLVVIVVYDVFSVADTVSKANGGTFDNGITIDEDGATVLTVDRATSDGSIIDLQKDGSAVGSIGVTGTDILYVANPDGSAVGFNFDGDNPKINPCDGTGSGTDGVADLGHSGGRYKDLYLSGGVYLGGTGSANKLDDYEEGAWTPDFLNDGATTYDHQVGRYVKIGQLVMAWFHIDVNSNSIGTNALRVGNLPFTGLNVNNEASYGAVSALHCNNWSTTNKPDNGLVPSSSTYADLYKSQGTTGTSQLNGNDIGGGNLIGCIIYRAA